MGERASRRLRLMSRSSILFVLEISQTILFGFPDPTSLHLGSESLLEAHEPQKNKSWAEPGANEAVRLWVVCDYQKSIIITVKSNEEWC